MRLEEFMREMVRREEEIVASVRGSLEKMSHPAVKGVLEGCSCYLKQYLFISVYHIIS